MISLFLEVWLLYFKNKKYLWIEQFVIIGNYRYRVILKSTTSHLIQSPGEISINTPKCTSAKPQLGAPTKSLPIVRTWLNWFLQAWPMNGISGIRIEYWVLSSECHIWGSFGLHKFKCHAWPSQIQCNLRLVFSQCKWEFQELLEKFSAKKKKIL